MSPLFTRPQLKKLILPLMAEQLLAVLVGMADIVMVSAAGEAAISGVSLVDMLNVLLINLFAALCTGGAVVTSQLLGAKKQQRACESAMQLIMVAGLFATAIAAAVIFLRTPLLRLLFGAIEPDVMDASRIYLVLSAFSYPFLAMYNACAALLRSMNNARISMYTSMGMNAVNIAGNAICIYGLGMGVAGVAVPTLVSRALAALVMLYVMRNPALPVHILRGVRFRFDGVLIKNILRIGVPSALENGMFQLGRVLVVSLIAGFGTVQIAANGVANSLDSLGCIPGQAINLAIIAVVGRCVGAGDWAQARSYTKKLLGFTYLVTACINSVILLTLPWTLRLYSLSGETLSLAYTLVMIHNGCAILLWPASFTLPNALRAAGDVKYTMVVAIFSMWAFRLGGSWVLGGILGMGAVGVWAAMVIDWIFRASLYLVRFAGTKWQHKALTE